MNPTAVSSDKLKALCPNRAWPLAVANQVCTSCGIGLCDDILCNFVRGAEAWSYDTVLVQWGLAGASDPLTVTAGTEYDLFNSGGVNEALVGGWGQTKGLEYTDLLQGGVPVDRGFMMVVCGAAVRTALPFQQGENTATGAQDESSPQLHPAWLKPDDDGTMYSQRLQAITQELTSLRLKLGDTGCIYYLGNTSIFASYAGPSAGGHIVVNGAGVSIPGAYTPFMVCFCIGSLNDLKRATIQMFVGQSAAIESDGTTPTALVPVGDSTGANGKVYVPYQVILFGYVVSGDTALQAAGLDPASVNALKQLIALAQSQGQLPPG